MSLTMRKFALVFLCLACSGYGRRVQPSVEQMKSLQSDDTALSSKQGELASIDRQSHEEHPEKSITKSASLSWLSALGGVENRLVGDSIWSDKAYFSLCITCVLIFVLCVSFCLTKHFVTSSKSDLSQHVANEYSVYFRVPQSDPTLEKPTAEQLDALGTACQNESASLSILFAKLKAWRVGQAVDVAAPILSPDEKDAKDDFVGSDTDDTGGISDPPDISDSAGNSDNSSIIAEESSSAVNDDIGNVSDLSDSSDADSSISVREVEPLTMETYNISPTLLSQDVARSLLEYLPAGLRIPGASLWRLCYKPLAHGTSMATLHRKIAGCESSLLLIRDADDHVFGGFAPSPWKIGSRFHGTGEAFVFTCGKLGSGTPEDEDDEQASSEIPEVKVFPWTSSNHYFMYAENGLLAMGGGDGCHALAIHEGLLCGHSSPTPTFGNPALSAAPEGDFVVKDMELWSLDYTTSTMTW